MIASLVKNAYRPEVLQKAPTYNEKEVGALDRSRASWANLAANVEMAVGKLNAKEGERLANDISRIATSLINLAKAVLEFDKVIPIFDTISKAFQGWAMILNGITGVANSANSGNLAGDAKGFLSELPGIAKEIGKSIIGSEDEEGDAKVIQLPMKQNPIAPTMPYNKTDNKSNVVNNNVQQTLNFNHDGKDAQKTAGSVRDGASRALRQMPQGQAN
jgi:hypothetical protein